MKTYELVFELNEKYFKELRSRAIDNLDADPPTQAEVDKFSKNRDDLETGVVAVLIYLDRQLRVPRRRGSTSGKS